MVQIFFAFLGGILTVAAPCILPMLPILLGANVGQGSKRRPLFIVLGFIVSFAAASLVLSAIITHLGLSPNALRYGAIALLFVFSVFLVWPLPFELMSAKLSGLINKANQVGQSQSGDTGALLLGLVLGIVWTPCAGPVLGSILTLIATQGSTGQAVILVLAYALGAGVPMLIIAYGSQYVTTKVRGIARYATRIQQIFGVLVFLLALAMIFQYDTVIENKLTAFFPQSSLESKITGTATSNQPVAAASNVTGSLNEKIAFQNYGKAPEFTGIYHWLNSDPITMSSLKGKVVLIDFWTYSCINCIRTLPSVTKWYDTYKDKGFIVIGVHTPEFPFEKVTSNVQTAMDHFGIHYPVAQDNDYGTWQAFSNQYWPAEYLIDQNGQIVYEHFGEGNYDHTENAIRQLLGLNDPVSQNNGQDLSKVNSPEMYFGTDRLQYLTADQKPSEQTTAYQFPSQLKLNNFALVGSWQFSSQEAKLITNGGKIRLHFSSGKLFMVASSDKPQTITITVDGKEQPAVAVSMSQLYTLFDSVDYTDHVIEITIPDAGFNAFTFTFG